MGGQLVENIGSYSAPVSNPEEEMIAGNQVDYKKKDFVGKMVLDKAERQLEMEDQAKALAIEKPEDVAQLVKTWMHSKE